MGGTVKARNRCALKSPGLISSDTMVLQVQTVRTACGRGKTRRGGAMDPKRKKRPPAKVAKRIAEMKADRRRDLVKGALGLGAAVLLVVAKTALELCGLVSAENVAFVNLLLLMAMGLAIVTGTASIDFAKKGKAIRELCQEQGLSENDAKDMGLL